MGSGYGPVEAALQAFQQLLGNQQNAGAAAQGTDLMDPYQDSSAFNAPSGEVQGAPAHTGELVPPITPDEIARQGTLAGQPQGDHASSIAGMGLHNPYPILTEKQAAAQAQQDRINSMAGDIASYTAGGGEVKNRPELGVAFGSYAKSKIEAAKQATDLETFVTERNAARDTLAAQHTIAQAEAWHKINEQYNQEAQNRWSDWQRRVREAENSKIDPARYWNDASNFTKAMWVVSFIGAGMTGKTANLQLALDAVHHAVDTDIGAQKADMANKENLLAQEQQGSAAWDLQNARYMDNLKLEQTNRINSLIKAIDAETARIGAPAAAQAKLADVRTGLEQEAFKLQTDFWNQAQGEIEAKKTRAHAIALEKMKEQHDFDMAKVDLQVANAKEDYKRQIAQDAAPALRPEIGVALTQRGKLVPGPIPLRPDEDAIKGANDTIFVANDTYTASLELLDRIKEMRKGFAGGNIAAALGGDPEFRSAYVKLSFAQARLNNGGRVTDKDYEQGGEQVAGIGITGDVKHDAWTIIHMPGDLGDVQKVLEKRIKSFQGTVEDKLGGYIAPGTRGDIHWSMRDLRAKDVVRNDADVAAEIAGPGRQATGATVARAPFDSSAYASTPRGPGTSSVDADAEARAAQTALDNYKAERDSGKLTNVPLPNPDDQRLLSAFESYLADYSGPEIQNRLADLEHNPLASDEAKLRARAEAALVMGRKMDLEQKAATLARDFPGGDEETTRLRWHIQNPK